MHKQLDLTSHSKLLIYCCTISFECFAWLPWPLIPSLSVPSLIWYLLVAPPYCFAALDFLDLTSLFCQCRHTIQCINSFSIFHSAAMQRKQEVFRQVMGFVSQNGRPPQVPAIGIPTSSAPATFPFQPPVLTRPETTETLGQHTNVGRVRYIQPSCRCQLLLLLLVTDIQLTVFVWYNMVGVNPKHADEEVWSPGSPSPLSLHLFFNLSSIQSQSRAGHQLYVIGAKLRLLKFAEVNK